MAVFLPLPASQPALLWAIARECEAPRTVDGFDVQIHSGTEDPQHISVVLFLITNKEKNHLGVSGSGGGRYMVKLIGTLNVPLIN